MTSISPTNGWSGLTQLGGLGPPLNFLGYLGLLDHLNLIIDVLACRRVDVADVGDMAGVLMWLANMAGVVDD